MGEERAAKTGVSWGVGGGGNSIAPGGIWKLFSLDLVYSSVSITPTNLLEITLDGESL